jgi:L-ascorbate metabolism protein UlaG (beta-lactamase superfamily)
MKLANAVAIGLLCAFPAVCAAAAEDARDESPAALKVTFLGNEGFLIASDSGKILVDALFGPPDAPEFPEAPGTDLLEEMISGKEPFDDVDFVLVTHDHPDHFGAGSLAKQLARNPGSRLFCPKAAAGRIEKAGESFRDLAPRIESEDPPWGEGLERSAGGIRVRVLGMRHADEVNRDMPHRAYLVEMGGRKFLHLGDALGTRENLERFSWLAKEGIDVAFVPYWMIRSKAGVALVKEILRPKRVVAMHIPLRDASRWAEGVKRIEKDLAPISVFVSRMESRTF